MLAASILQIATTLVSVYREALLLDPFVKISLDLADGAFTSECTRDTPPLAWRIKLNPSRHNDAIDVQYSIVDAVLQIMFDDLSPIDDNKLLFEYKRRLISRLTTAICQMMDASDVEQGISDEE